MNDRPAAPCGAGHTRFGHFVCGLPAGHTDPHGSWVTRSDAPPRGVSHGEAIGNVARLLGGRIVAEMNPPPTAERHQP